jgi:uncharacterized membrane protein
MTPAGSHQVRAVDRDEMRLNSTISKVLVTGLLLAMALLAVGVVLTVARPGVAVPHATSIKDIPEQLAALEPGGFYQLGLLVLIATPFARVVALGIAFSLRRQWLFAGISFFVMALLILGAVLGLSLG